MERLRHDISTCTRCAEKFAATHTAHAPRPVVWFKRNARILVAGQAPGLRVHQTGIPFNDPSGDRLRNWMGLERDAFYDQDRVAIVPMAFCFPGYNAAGSDLPPPRICAETWRGAVMQQLASVQLTLLVGGYAQAWHLGKDAKGGVNQTVAAWRDHAPQVFPLPHPSWRNTGWIKNNPWFANELLPELKSRVNEVMNDRDNAA